MILIILQLATAFRLPLQINPRYLNSKNSPYSVSIPLSNEKFDLALDFSVPYVIIFSSACMCTNTSIFVENTKRRYLVNKSISQSIPESIQYKNYTLQGIFYDMPAAIPGHNITLKVFITLNSSSFIGNFYNDGVLGLGITNQEDTTYVEQIGKINEAFNFGLVLENSYDKSVTSFIELCEKIPNDYFVGKTRTKDMRDYESDWKMYSSVIIENIEYSHLFETRFDINLNTIKVPDKTYNQVFSVLNRSLGGIDEKMSFFCGGRDFNLSFILKIQGTRFPLRLKDFIETQDGMCRVLIEENDKSEWVLGRPFFRDYFVVFGYERKDIKYYQLDYFRPGWYELAIFVFPIFAFVFSLVFACCVMSEMKNREELLDCLVDSSIKKEQKENNEESPTKNDQEGNGLDDRAIDELQDSSINEGALDQPGSNFQFLFKQKPVRIVKTEEQFTENDEEKILDEGSEEEKSFDERYRNEKHE